MNPADENRLCIMEVLYRHRASGGEDLSMEAMKSIEVIDAERLGEDVEYLEAGGLVELVNGFLGLTDHGFMVMDNRELSFCPHL